MVGIPLSRHEAKNLAVIRLDGAHRAGGGGAQQLVGRLARRTSSPGCLRSAARTARVSPKASRSSSPASASASRLTLADGFAAVRITWSLPCERSSSERREGLLLGQRPHLARAAQDDCGAVAQARLDAVLDPSGQRRLGLTRRVEHDVAAGPKRGHVLEPEPLEQRAEVRAAHPAVLAEVDPPEKRGVPRHPATVLPNSARQARRTSSWNCGSAARAECAAGRNR